MENKYIFIIDVEPNIKKYLTQGMKQEGYYVVELEKSIILAKKENIKVDKELEEKALKYVLNIIKMYKNTKIFYIDFSKEINSIMNALEKNSKCGLIERWMVRQAITKAIMDKHR